MMYYSKQALRRGCPHLHIYTLTFPVAELLRGTYQYRFYVEFTEPLLFNINPSNEYSGLISFRMDWFDVLTVQGTLKSLLQHHTSKASSLQLSAFFIVQLSHPYMTTGKSIALTRWTLVGKVMSLLFNNAV